MTRMAKVQIFGSLRAATDGKSEVEIDASTLRELLDGLANRYPGLRPQLDRGVSVAIDGRVYNDSWFTPIRDDSEVVCWPASRGADGYQGLVSACASCDAKPSNSKGKRPMNPRFGTPPRRHPNLSPAPGRLCDPARQNRPSADPPGRP